MRRVTAIVVLVFAAAAVVAAPAAALKTKTFQAPSGNIGCVLLLSGSGNEARCDVAQHTWKVIGTQIWGDEGGVTKYLVLSLSLGFYLWTLSFLLLALTPSWFGHLFINPKDIPFAAGYVWSLYFLVRCLESVPMVPWCRSVALSIALGLTLTNIAATLAALGSAAAIPAKQHNRREGHSQAAPEQSAAARPRGTEARGCNRRRAPGRDHKDPGA